MRRFNGKEADQLSRLGYYGVRYYDEQSLTWTQADPLFRIVPDLAYDKPRLMSLYAFSLNNPIRYFDPDGRWPSLRDIGGGLASAASALGTVAVKAKNIAVDSVSSTASQIVDDPLTAVLDAGSFGLYSGGTVEDSIQSIEDIDTLSSGEGGDGAEDAAARLLLKLLPGTKAFRGAKDRRARQRGPKKKDGSPGNNQAQNKQFKDATRGLTKAQKEKLHREISGHNLSFREIQARAAEIKAE